MKKNASLREKMGLSQKEMADLLGIAKGVFSLHELGQRSLPTPALLKMGKLEILLQEEKAGKAVAAPMAVPKEARAKAVKLYQAIARKAELGEIKTTIKLKQLQDSQQKYTRLLAAVQHLKASAPAKSAERPLLELMEIESKEKLERYSVVEQARLQYNISLLKHQRKAAEEALAAL